MIKFYNEIVKPGSLNEWNCQLMRQVDTLWPKDAVALEEHGLRDAETVLDIGTGNGYFLAKLAQAYPEKRFAGIEPNAEVLKVARELIKTNGLKNVELINAPCPVRSLKNKFDLIFSRLTIYCTPDREKIIEWANSRLTRNGRMVIMDVDDDHVFHYPANKGLSRFYNALRKTTEAQGADRSVGRKLPYFLQKSGFKDIKVDYKFWFSSFALQKNVFQDYWSPAAKFMNVFAPKLFNKNDMKDFVNFIGKVKRSKNHIISSPIIIASGMK